MMAVLALAVPAGTFAYRGMFGGYIFPAVPTILKAGTVPNKIVQNNSDETSVTSAGSSEKLQPIDIRELAETGAARHFHNPNFFQIGRWRSSPCTHRFYTRSCFGGGFKS